MVKQLILQLVLILLNAFFAATEIAVISLNEKKVRAQAEDGSKKAKKLLKVIQDPTKFLSTIQIGITLAGFLGSAFAADNFAERLTAWMVRVFEISPERVSLINTLSVIVITLILSYFTLVLGELVPKRVAMRHKEKLANISCGVISALSIVLKPVIWFLTVSTNAMLRLFRIDPRASEETVSEEDIVIMLDAGVDDGTLDKEDITYIKNVFKLDNLTAADVMTQRSAVVALPLDASIATVLDMIAKEGYSRIPVYRESIDHIVGVLHAKDFLLHHQEADFSLESSMKEVEFVPETAHLDVVLKGMQKKHAHLVVVVNEYGMTSGVVTMEDILEELVGEILDEQDDEIVAPIKEIGDGLFRVQSMVSIEEFFEFFSLEANESITSTTVNGWLMELCGAIPEVSYTVTYENLTLTVIDADQQMTHEIEVLVKKEQGEVREELPPC